MPSVCSYQTSDALTSELAWFRPPALSPPEYASRASSAAASASTAASAAASQSEPRAASTRGPVTGGRANHQQELAPAPASYDAYDSSSRAYPLGEARAAGRRARGAGGRDFHRRARGRFVPYAEPRAMRATAAGGGDESTSMAPSSDQMGDVTPTPSSCPPLSGGESLGANANAVSSEPLPASAGASSQLSEQQQPQQKTRGGRWRARGRGTPRAVVAEEAGGALPVLGDPMPARGLPYRRGQRRGGGHSGFGWRGEQWRARGNGVGAVRGGAEAGSGSAALTTSLTSDRASQSLANVADQQDLGKSEKHIANTIESKDSNHIDA